MFKKRLRLITLVICFILGFWLRADGPDTPESATALHIDVPVTLQKAEVVFDVGHLVLMGDMPFVLGDAGLLMRDLGDWHVQGHVVAVLHGDAAFWF